MSIEDCLQLAVKVLNKTMDSTAPAADKMELTTIQRINGKVNSHIHYLSTILRLQEYHDSESCISFDFAQHRYLL
jgi:20S proteasome alpha/beta subunit